MKTCPYCAEEIQDAAIVCKHCSRDLVPKRMGSAAPWLKVLWVVAVGVLLWVFIAVAIMAIAAFNFNMAQVRMVQSGISEVRVRSHISRVKNDQRSLATAIETYLVDHRSFPPETPLLSTAEGDQKELIEAGGGNLTTLFPGNKTLAGLTTPVAYLTSIFTDPFFPRTKVPFAYAGGAVNYIIFSRGPDGNYDIVPGRDFDPDEHPTPTAALLQRTYDPTNGTTSPGDIWRIGQSPLRMP